MKLFRITYGQQRVCVIYVAAKTSELAITGWKKWYKKKMSFIADYEPDKVELISEEVLLPSFEENSDA